MNFLRNNALSFATVLAFLLLSWVSDATAAQIETAPNTVFGTAMSKGSNLFRNVRSIIFMVGGFGLVALAFFAVFGKLKWTWFASLAVGLAILAAAGSIIDYATTTSGTGSFANADYLGDTMTGVNTGGVNG